VTTTRMQVQGAKTHPVEVGTSPTNANVWFQVLPMDPLRAGIIFDTAGSVDFLVSTDPAPISGQGLLVSSSREPLMLKFAEYGALLGSAWYALMTAMSGTLTIITVDYHEDW
jgi:hypothetical protein